MHRPPANGFTHHQHLEPLQLATQGAQEGFQSSHIQAEIGLASMQSLCVRVCGGGGGGGDLQDIQLAARYGGCDKLVTAALVAIGCNIIRITWSCTTAYLGQSFQRSHTCFCGRLRQSGVQYATIDSVQKSAS